MDETYRNRAQGDILTNTKRTLCYDWLKKRNSIILETSSNQVILSFYCLASKYSTFMMNFSFHYAPAECKYLIPSVYVWMYECMYE